MCYSISFPKRYQTENEGLTELLKDLEGQLEDINEEKLIANALKMV